MFESAAEEAAFDEYISGESCLEEQRGRIMERNSCRNPWQNQLDVAIRQRLPVFRGDAAFEVQIFNFLRMLDRDWGQVKTVESGRSPTTGRKGVDWGSAGAVIRGSRGARATPS